MVRTVTTQDQYANLERLGYIAQVVKNDQGKTVQVLLTKSFGFWGKVGLFIIALAKTIFTLHINEKTKEEWKALSSGKITLILHENLFQIADKTIQQAGKHLTKGAQQSNIVPATAYTPPKPSTRLLSEALDLREEGLQHFICESVTPALVHNQPLDIAQNREEMRITTLAKIEESYGKLFIIQVGEDGKRYIAYRYDVAPNPINGKAIEPCMQQVCCFLGASEQGAKSHLLRKFDVVTVPCILDYDGDFNLKSQEELRTSKQFNVLCASPLNVGENRNAEDFRSYYKKNVFSEDNYIADTEKIIHDIFQAQAALDQKNNGAPSQNIDSVWTTFGMASYQSELGQNDPTYQNKEAFFNLKRKVAHAIFAQLDHFKNVTMHLCIPLSGVAAPIDQLIFNYNAFIAELKLMPRSLQSRVIIYVNQDATELAQNLANQKGSNKVALLMGVRRTLLGGHWFIEGAPFSMEEQLAVRGEKVAEMFYLLNRGTDARRDKKPGELPETVATYGGAVFKLENSGAVLKLSLETKKFCLFLSN